MHRKDNDQQKRRRKKIDRYTDLKFIKRIQIACNKRLIDVKDVKDLVDRRQIDMLSKYFRKQNIFT